MAPAERLLIKTVKILMIGDVVGSPGRRILAKELKRLRRELSLAAVVVNAENCAAGSGLTAALAKEIFDAGADAITLGDHTWDQKETGSWLAREKRAVRPANFADACPGRGWTRIETPVGAFVVANLLGRVFMNPVDNPFLAIDRLLAGPVPRDVPVIVDFHAEATSEKIAMGRHLDGRAAAVFGTHTHVQTSDTRVLPGGTGYITDIGMTGPVDSVIGREAAPVLHKFLTDMPAKFDVAKGPCELCGCVFDVDPSARRCRSAAAVRLVAP